MSAGELDIIEGVVDAELVDPRAPIDPAVAAVLAALEQGADEYVDDLTPKKTKTGYARDWTVWGEFHAWLAERTGTLLPLTTATRGTMVSFVKWLDEIQLAAPATIDRRLTGVTVTCRSLGVEVPKDATVAARKALKPLKLDRKRQARGRGQAVAATPANLRQMNTAVPAPRRAGTPREYRVHQLVLIRDRSLATLAFGIAGRAAEVSALTVDGITVVAGGLEVVVPSVKGRPGRTVAVHEGEHDETCPVLLWKAWKEAAGITEGPAFRGVDQWGHVGERRLSPDGCRIVITRSAERAGIEARLTGHSARAGLVTTAIKNRKRVDKIQEQSGHSMESPVFWRYVRDGQRWEDAATDGIGL
jgi:integrase